MSPAAEMDLAVIFLHCMAVAWPLLLAAAAYEHLQWRRER